MEASYYLTDQFWKSEEIVFLGEKNSDIPQSVLEKLPKSSVLFQSSGSSGVEKWIVHTRESLLVSAQGVNEHLALTKNDTFGLLLPHVHVGGFGILARAYQLGASCFAHTEKWNPEKATEFLGRHEITVTSLVPTQVYDLVKKELSAPKCLKVVIVGGGQLDIELGKRARELGWPVIQSYGMSEAGSQIATPSLEGLSLPYTLSELEVLPFWDVSTDGEGRLGIKGEALAKGVLIRGGDGWSYNKFSGEYKTQDRVDLKDRKISFLGRADRIVKVKGELVDLDKLETKVSLKLKAQVVFVSVEHERDGCVLKAYSEGLLSREAIQACIPNFVILESYVQLVEIPKSALGKVNRKELIKRA